MMNFGGKKIFSLFKVIHYMCMFFSDFPIGSFQIVTPDDIFLKFHSNVWG